MEPIRWEPKKWHQAYHNIPFPCWAICLAGEGEERHEGMRDSIIFYRSFYDAIKDLPAEQQVDCFHAIMDYALDGKEPEGSGIEKTVFMLVQPQIDINNQRYVNGMKGGRPRRKVEYHQETAERKPSGKQAETKVEPRTNQIGTKPEPKDNQTETTAEPRNNQTETEPEPNVNDNDNGNVNDNGNDKTERKDPRVCACVREGCASEAVTGILGNGSQLGQGNEKPEPGMQFSAFWESYPKQVERQMAFQEYLSLLKNTQGLDEDSLIQAARNYAEACQIRKTAERFIKYPANWLVDGTWMDYMPPVYRKPEAEDKPRKQESNQFLAFQQRGYSQKEYQTMERRLLGRAGDG